MSTNTTTEKPATVREHEAAMLLQSELAEGLRSETGLLPEFANEIAGRLTKYLRLRMGAQRIYIPGPDKADRDAAIYRDFDGTNAPAVMQRYDISRSRLYQICDEQRALIKSGSPVSCLKTGQTSA